MAKLKATTIMEALIAMILIMVCLGIGTMIFVNVLQNDRGRSSLKAMLLLKAESKMLRQKQLFVDGEEKQGEWLIQRTFEKYDNTENVLQMNLKLTDENGKVIAEQNELIIPAE